MLVLGAGNVLPLGVVHTVVHTVRLQEEVGRQSKNDIFYKLETINEGQ